MAIKDLLTYAEEQWGKLSSGQFNTPNEVYQGSKRASPGLHAAIYTPGEMMDRGVSGYGEDLGAYAYDSSQSAMRLGEQVWFGPKEAARREAKRMELPAPSYARQDAAGPAPTPAPTPAPPAEGGVSEYASKYESVIRPSPSSPETPEVGKSKISEYEESLAKHGLMKRTDASGKVTIEGSKGGTEPINRVGPTAAEQAESYASQIYGAMREGRWIAPEHREWLERYEGRRTATSMMKEETNREAFKGMAAARITAEAAKDSAKINAFMQKTIAEIQEQGLTDRNAANMRTELARINAALLRGYSEAQGRDLSESQAALGVRSAELVLEASGKFKGRKLDRAMAEIETGIAVMMADPQMRQVVLRDYRRAYDEFAKEAEAGTLTQTVQDLIAGRMPQAL